MENTYFFRGVSFIKDYIIQYLKYIFKAEHKGQLNFVDGTTKMVFSQLPNVVKYLSWTERELPAILVEAASGGLQDMGVAKGLVDAPTEGESDGREWGGDINLSVILSVIATQIPERDKLVDVVCIFLNHPAARDYFGQHNILLPSAPTIRGESVMNIPNIDHPVYRTGIGLDVVGNWRIKESADLSLLDIIVDLSDMVD